VSVGSSKLAAGDNVLIGVLGCVTVNGLYWQVLAPVAADYKVSARLLDAEGNQIAQIDDAPVHNTYATSRWKTGETIADVYDLAVPSDTPSGPYRLLVILYEPDTLAEGGTGGTGNSPVVKPRRDALQPVQKPLTVGWLCSTMASALIHIRHRCSRRRQ